LILTGIGIILQSGWRRNEKPPSISVDDTHLTDELPRSPQSVQSPPPATLPSGFCQNIYKLVCQYPGETADQTGVVSPDFHGEKQVLKIYSNIIEKNPDFSVEQVNEELARQVYQGRKRIRIESGFRWVTHTLLKFIDRQPDSVFTSAEKQQLKARIIKTRLELPPPASLYADEPDLLKKTEALYERTNRGEMRLRIGGAYLYSAKSWFNVVFTLAHELGHSIDPCEVRYVGLAFPAYDRLTACFLHQKLISTRSTRSECGQDDQLSETFADWIAVQITTETLKSFSDEFQGPQLVNAIRNSVRDLCDQEDEDTESDLTFHPSPKVRIDKIFGQNPEIRELLNCDLPVIQTPLLLNPPTQSYDYCSFNWDLPASSEGSSSAEHSAPKPPSPQPKTQSPPGENQ
jgi:hypothetical protein